MRPTTPRFGMDGRLFLLVGCLLLWVLPESRAFSSRIIAKGHQTSSPTSFHLLSSSSSRRLASSINDDDDDVWEGPEQSQMFGFISDYLRKEQGQKEPSPSYQIAIPLDSAHELCLELESVQRAVLYHCPLLVHACIPQAITKLPLLDIYGQTTPKQLQKALQRVVQEVLLVVSETDTQESQQQDGPIRNDGTVDLTGANSDHILPLTIPFCGLEVDGIGNQVLLTVADPQAPGTQRLGSFVQALQSELGALGLEARLPVDPHAANKDEYRARVPFMKLPDDWETKYLNAQEFLPSDQGGNGISPILWGKWMSDRFGGPTRMREIGVYAANSNLPLCSVSLPAGNDALSSIEKQHQAYYEERMTQAEEELKSDKEKIVDDNDPLYAKTRDRLEELYSMEDLEDDDDDEEEELDFSSPSKSMDLNAIDDWTKERIRAAVESRARLRSEKELATPKTKPPIDENPIFAKYKDGTLVPQNTKTAEKPQLPPFPSREHLVGFWRIVSSPTGFEVEDGDSSRSDNLILRIDGTTAGGPILDQETRQKASGGTWKLMGDTRDNASLRIRLVIPPEKERILVLKGRVERISMDASDLPLAKNTFGIPQLEEKASRSAMEMEDLLLCNGDVHIEDAVTGLNRESIGKFSIMKLNTPTDPSQYTITIPRPVRNQD